MDRDMRCPNCRLDCFDEDHINEDGQMVYECRECGEQFYRRRSRIY